MQAQLHGWLGGQIANIQTGKVAGERILGGFRIKVGLEITPPSSPPDEQPTPMILVDGELVVKNRPVGHLRLLIATQLQWQLPPSTAFEIPLVGDLSRTQIEAIETERNGGDLELSVLFKFTVGPGGNWPVHIPVFDVVPASEWVKVLTEMDYQRTVLVEIPLPAAQMVPGLAGVVARVEAAQRELIGGRYQASVGNLRMALEELDTAIGKPLDLSKELRDDLGPTRAWPKAQRIDLLRRVLYIVVSPAHHSDPVASKFKWDRTDAISLLAMTAALISELGAVQAKVDAGDALSDPDSESPPVAAPPSGADGSHVG